MWIYQLHIEKPWQPTATNKVHKRSFNPISQFMPQSKLINLMLSTKLLKTSISPASQCLFRSRSRVFPFETDKIPLFEKSTEETLLLITLLSHLMITMQEKKLIWIPFLLLPKSRYEKGEEHTITPSRQSKRYFFFTRKTTR